MTMYGKGGGLGDAWKLFSMILDKSLVSWNSMISGYALEGHVHKVLSLFE